MKTLKTYLVATAFVLALGAPASVYAYEQPTVASERLEQLLAPIALYPDPLIVQILEAATYPHQIVEAEQWLDNPATARLSNDQFTWALQQMPWDSSVKALTTSPQVLRLLRQNIQWTGDIGTAFLDHQSAVMGAVQNLRWRAANAGTLATLPDTQIFEQDSNILIEPVDPNHILIPSYNPDTAYGVWYAGDYPPYQLSVAPVPAPVYLVPVAPLPPPVTTQTFWLGYGWDWQHRRIDNDEERHFQHEEHEERENSSIPAPRHAFPREEHHDAPMPQMPQHIEEHHDMPHQEQRQPQPQRPSPPLAGMPIARPAPIEQHQPAHSEPAHVEPPHAPPQNTHAEPEHRRDGDQKDNDHHP